MSLDRVSNMLSSIKNASMANNAFVETYYTKECESIANVLKEAGFLTEVKTFKPKGKAYKGLRLDLAVENKKFLITDIKRFSKPGRRIYLSSTKFEHVPAGQGVLVVSTSKGVISGQEAKKRRLGGELICKVF